MMASRDHSSDVLSAEVHEVISAPEINLTNGLREILRISYKRFLAKAVTGGLLTYYLITTFLQDSRIGPSKKTVALLYFLINFW